ncbi:MAG TPA: metallopeptidase family protein [Syntrophales bacterium]|nr:metallopeptidase family protein [Syntrophales bacterium]HOM07418.1 metallopeptidase family protein [Syntrophales bacterium]HON99990.1 metallopeptidase family protein [Syntrophales bacterium]HPC01510.1 metallopeptidase family protein [Syntrophales bacterium]HPQ07059.1 metallopeptidase family protein [Syntrophales bacterium]
MRLTAREFDRAVARAIARIPDEIRSALDNVVITVRKRPSRDLLERIGYPLDEPPPLGLYVGESLRERSFFSPPPYPDTIFIFQEPLEEMCATLEELEEEIEITVVHEIAHFLGIDDGRLAELGYE